MLKREASILKKRFHIHAASKEDLVEAPKLLHSSSTQLDFIDKSLLSTGPGMSDEEAGDAAADAVSAASWEEHPSSSTLQQPYVYNVYTAVAFPGCEVFSSWLERAKEDQVKDASLDAFMGRYYKVEDATEGGDATEGSNVVKDPVDFIHADYQLFDTPVWRARKRDLITKKLDELKNKKQRRCARNRNGQADLGQAVHDLDRIRRYGSRVLVIMIGIGMALIGYAIISAADALHDVRTDYVQSLLPDFGKGFVAHVGIAVAYITVAYIPVAYKPIVAGSGIDYAKAILNGVNVPEASTFVTLVCKAVGIIFTSAASLPAGLEGPMIHNGLCLGANAWRIVPRNIPAFDHLFSDRSRRDFAAIGTSAGVAAAFLSPIGGILFAMEEGASYWSIQLMWKCVNASTTTLLVWFLVDAVRDTVSGGFGPKTLPLKLAGYGQFITEVHYWEFAVVAVIGFAAGLIGSAFVEINIRLTKLRRRLNFSKPLQLLEVIFFTVLMATLTWCLPLAYTVCRVDNAPAMQFIQFNCPDGQYNELATLLQAVPSTYGLKHTFHSGADAFTIQSLVIAGCVYLFVLLFLFGAKIVMGIFIPLLYAGSCFGRAIALWLGLKPFIYAVVGASAMLCSVVRVVISLTVIVLVEATGLPYLMIPLLITNIAARSVANKLSKSSIYEKLLELKDIPFLEEETPKALTHRMLHARDIMSSRPLVKLPSEVGVAQLVQTLKDYGSYGEYPVLHGDQFIGVIKQYDLLILLGHKGLFYSEADKGSDLQSSHRTLTHSELRRTYPDKPNLEEVEASLTEEDLSCYLDLAPYVQIAPSTFDAHGSAERTYELYRTLGLRSLIVVDNNARPIGEVRRRDLYSFQQEEGSEKMKMKAA